MKIESARARQLLKDLDFRRLFQEQLGWDKHQARLDVPVDGFTYVLAAIAEKRGFAVYTCARIPDRAIRLKIDRQVTKSAREHLIIYMSADKTRQVWQWVRRESGKPLANRDFHYDVSQSGEALIQKLEAIAFGLEEEEKLTIVDVAGRVKAALDVDKVTKRFYDRFKAEHEVFQKFIKGIDSEADLQWYTSLMLNRLMFVYFIQKKSFLDGDPDYLRNRLRRMQQKQGKNKFLSFYRYFLLRLFHEGLGMPESERKPELEKLLGRIPYLNGGFFEVHQLEKTHLDIDIPDRAFEKLFDFFDAYRWHLDERPLRADNEINPDVVGYIFEKYVNQKQMGAYYTKEDITEYISKNTLIPFLFDAARAKCKVAFENPKGPTVWDLLRESPDRYIYPAVRHGLTWDIYADSGKGNSLKALRLLPADIAAGLTDVSKRTNWNKPAPAGYALPTEIWREVVARRKRCEEIRQKLAAGEVCDINELITLNLDIRQFAQDVIEDCEGPELLRAFWHAIESVTVLDPTCGSGAFLFAALNILEPLYEACLDRMEAFILDLDHSGEKHRPEKFSDFRKVLERVASHPNRRYFIFKSIILNNLFGVDIMEEAVEICKLRLFLKVAAQVEPDPGKKNLGVEPLPDIDFNIRAGNTLVGFARYDEVKKAVTSKFDFESAMEKISVRAADLQQTFDAFRQRQTEGDDSVPTEHKLELRRRLKALEDELNRYLAGEHGVDAAEKGGYDKWLKSHKPFHWFVEFHGIMQSGFDVIIGNPPYVELNALGDYHLRGYTCEASGNLYALVMERCGSLITKEGWQGYIVPVSSVSTDRYATLQHLLTRREDYFSAYDDRPSRLFDGLEHSRLTIHLIGKLTRTPKFFSTRYKKWMADERPAIFSRLQFTSAFSTLVEGTLPKLCSELEQSIIQKLRGQRRKLCSFYSGMGQYEVLYSRKVGYFLQVLDFEPVVLDGRGHRRSPSEFKALKFCSERQAKLALCCLNSNLFYWFVTIFSDCRHINKREIDVFPINLDTLGASASGTQLLKLAQALMHNLQENSMSRRMRFRHDTLTVQCIFPKTSKPIIDGIDQVLAGHYGFTDEELDFIINYDIKYRMGRDSEAEEE